jgi:SPP1 gp7 family putative phage head morphogenesis protein
MANPTDKIHHKFISHAVDLSRFEEEISQRVLLFLKLLEKELAQDIQEGLGTGYTQAKLAALRRQTKASIATAYKSAENTLVHQVNQLPETESKFVVNAINSAIGADIVTTTLTLDQLNVLTDKTMIMGAPSSDWWKDQSNRFQNKFMVEMQLGVSRGETLDQLTQRIRGKATNRRTGYKTKSGKQRFMVDFKGGIMDVQTRNAQALIRTSVQQVANEARHMTLKANDDVIKGVVWLSTLDMRTTSFCRAMDGLEWTLDGEAIGGHSEPFNPPPQHWNCRSTLVPLLKSWEELSKMKTSELKKKIPESTRASMGGPVSENLNYKQWFDKQSEAIQLDILGPGKLAIYKRGNLSFRDMIDQRGNPLTIEELKAA